MNSIRTLSLDLETYSSVDLVKCGVYKYAESPDFEILLFAYSVNNEPVQVVDIAGGEEIPEVILAALTDDFVEKWAYNAQFERVCLSNWLRRHHSEHFTSYSIPEDSVGGYLAPYAWKCSRIWGAYLGLPLSLKGVGAVLKLDEQKMEEGAGLIKYFCKPCRPTKKNGGRTRNFPRHDPEKWEMFKKYNKRDVEVELSIKARLAKFPVPDFIWDEYHLDQEINDRGILVDMTLVEQAIAIDAKTKHSLQSRMRETTGLENPNSVTQMKDWLSGYLELIKDEMNAQEDAKQDGRCSIPDGRGGLKRCPCRITNPEYVSGGDMPKTIPVRCEGCKYEPTRQAHTVFEMSALDREGADGEAQPYEAPAPENYYDADRYEQMRKHFVAFVEERNPKLAPLAEALTLEFTKSEAARMLGDATSTVGSRNDKLKKLALEFLDNVITF